MSRANCEYVLPVYCVSCRVCVCPYRPFCTHSSRSTALASILPMGSSPIANELTPRDSVLAAAAPHSALGLLVGTAAAPLLGLPHMACADWC
jgi:hypothetical protein